MLLSREATFAEVVDWIDIQGVNGKTASAHLVLGNQDQVTVKAGGPGVLSGPASPFQTYEVLTCGEPPRFWRKYGDSAGVTYARVPRLLIAHHVARSGGIRDVLAETVVREEQQMLRVKMMVNPARMKDLGAALSEMVGVTVISSRLTPV